MLEVALQRLQGGSQEGPGALCTERVLGHSAKSWRGATQRPIHFRGQRMLMAADRGPRPKAALCTRGVVPPPNRPEAEC